jgi:hypothetical protein
LDVQNDVILHVYGSLSVPEPDVIYVYVPLQDSYVEASLSPVVVNTSDDDMRSSTITIKDIDKIR